MAGMAPTESGGRRTLDAELNLVPFIDLLCSLIAFLLMTAVWSQIAALEVQQTAAGEAVEMPKETLGLRVFVRESGFKVVGKDLESDLPLDFSALQSLLADKHGAFPDEREVYVDVADKVPYDTMIKTMDTCTSAGFPSINLGGSAL
jgi:biopolymer transport protein ExbD